MGAVLCPVDNIIHEKFHCSPLLTRPKDVNKRRVILNLSHIKDNSLNSHVGADNYDSSPFILKFPTVDDIADKIVRSTEDTVLFKVDIECAFRNLRVNPAHSLKCGISWRGAFYIDVGIVFRWMHGSASFQIYLTQYHISRKEKEYNSNATLTIILWSYLNLRLTLLFIGCVNS